jgi:soluble lytic murein transglycosylase-like protein
MIRLNRWLLAAGVALGACVAAPAMADIYSFKDEKGIVHFTNIKGLDNRYKLVARKTARRSFPPPAPRRASSCRRRRTSIATRTSSRRPPRPTASTSSLVHAVISAESGYDRYAVSRSGAMGLMQLMPETARRYGVQNIMDPAENIHGGVRYLADLMQMFKGRMDLAIAAYNAGENAVIRAGHKVPNYAETRHYVPKVLGFYKNFLSRS